MDPDDDHYIEDGHTRPSGLRSAIDGQLIGKENFPEDDDELVKASEQKFKERHGESFVPIEQVADPSALDDFTRIEDGRELASDELARREKEGVGSLEKELVADGIEKPSLDKQAPKSEDEISDLNYTGTATGSTPENIVSEEPGKNNTNKEFDTPDDIPLKIGLSRIKTFFDDTAHGLGKAPGNRQQRARQKSKDMKKMPRKN